MNDIAINNTILRGEVGSTAHGTGLPGHEDIDHMGIFVETAHNVCGLHPLDHYIYRDQPEGVRSQPGDLDLTLYSLRKWCRLAVKGNPSVIMLLWLPKYVVKTEIGSALIDMRQAFVGKSAGQAYLGYLIQQEKALLGLRSKKVIRPELVEQFGYDTKFAMHALRLGLQGVEYLTEGQLSIPVRQPDRSYLQAMRRGEVTFEDAKILISEAKERLNDAIETCPFTMDIKAVENFMVMAHHEHWGAL